MQGLNKTKAALQGRQCNYRKIKPSQITTLIDQVNNLGRVANMQLGIAMQRGQVKQSAILRSAAKSMPCPFQSGNYGKSPQQLTDSGLPPSVTAPLAQLIRDARISAHTVLVIPSAILRPLISLAFSQSKSFASWWVYPNLDRPDMSDFPQWGKSTPMADTLSRKSSLAAHSSGASLAFLRWRRLISPLAAAIKKPAVLSSFSLTCSINSKSSSGSLTETCRDLLFRLPVAITESPYLRWCSVCTKYLSFQALTWCSPYNTLVVFTLFVARCKNSEAPQVIATPAGPLTTNDRMSIEVAMLNHTQTRPKYQYRFLALHRSDRSAAPCRLSVEAFTEKEARQVLSAHFILSLAARLPVSEVRHA